MTTKEIKRIEENGLVAVITEREYDNGIKNYQVTCERVVSEPKDEGETPVTTKQYGYADTLEAAEEKAYTILSVMERDAKGTGLVWDERLKKAVKKD